LPLNKIYYIVVINEFGEHYRTTFAHSEIRRANKIATTFRLQSPLHGTFLSRAIIEFDRSGMRGSSAQCNLIILFDKARASIQEARIFDVYRANTRKIYEKNISI